MDKETFFIKLENLIEEFEFDDDDIHINIVACTITINDVEYIYNGFEFKKINKEWK